MRLLMAMCVVLVVLLCAATIVLVVQAQQNRAGLAALSLDRNLMPGHPMNNDFCADSEIQMRYRYCRDTHLTITVTKGVIRQVTIDTQDSGLNIGQVVAEWGSPIAADYTRYGTIAVYWADRYAYVAPDDHFS